MDFGFLCLPVSVLHSGRSKRKNLVFLFSCSFNFYILFLDYADESKEELMSITDTRISGSIIQNLFHYSQAFTLINIS